MEERSVGMRKARVTVAMLLTVSIMTQNVYAGIKLPDLGELASEAAEAVSGAVEAASGAVNQAGSVLSDAGKSVSETVSGAVGEADKVLPDSEKSLGERVSEAVDWAGEVLTDVKKHVGKSVSEASDKAGEVTGGFQAQADEFLSEWIKNARETADRVKESLKDAGIKIQDAAAQLGAATADKAAELTGKAGEAADDAIDAVKEARDLVVDKAGHVVDLASAGAGYVSDSASKTFQYLRENGEKLIQIGRYAVSSFDLSDPENLEQAKAAVNLAIEIAYMTGELNGAVDRQTLHTVTNILFRTLTYLSQYKEEKITLGKFTRLMSDMIIKEGLPTGVGFVVGLFDGSLPISKEVAKQVTYYLISKAYEDKDGAEIESEEASLFAAETEAFAAE